MLKINSIVAPKFINFSKTNLLPKINSIIPNGIIKLNNKINLNGNQKREYYNYYNKKNNNSNEQFNDEKKIYFGGAIFSGICFTFFVFSNDKVTFAYSPGPFSTLLGLIFFGCIIGIMACLWPLTWIIILAANEKR